MDSNSEKKRKAEVIQGAQFLNNNSRKRTKKTAGRKLSKKIITHRKKIQGNFQELKGMALQTERPTRQVSGTVIERQHRPRELSEYQG